MPQSTFPGSPPDPAQVPSSDPVAEEQAAAAAPAPVVQPVSSNPEEADILTRAQAGDHQAFAQIYTQHKRRIYSL